ncbi:MAG: hypothetical protein HETSPECPRED_010575 [Heterodermia speciosa]|uniref:Uncharacterized protein n=1 Tax=Heterodermia speciosa TaxID=116794 RepID=A0A8H3G5X7_9LECA|nr:MAG: hypothetical protein HETSPECPRED_010575 [Heterodermia speciosa]
MANKTPYNDENIRPEPLQQHSSPLLHDAEETTADDEKIASDEKIKSKDQREPDPDHDHNDDRNPGEQGHEDSDDADSSIPSGTEAQQEASNDN